jgi:AbrB family looped-hinge helix DNA binding protein
MAVAVDRFGRIVIPKELREAAGLRPGTPVQISFVEGAVVIRPVSGARRRNAFLEGVEERRRGYGVKLTKEELIDLCDRALEDL